MNQNNKNSPKHLGVQMLANFVLPILVLTKFSAALGPIYALLLALSFPLAYEAYNVYARKKVSAVSIIAIGGILITGLLGMLQVSSFLMAIRRSLPYVFMSVALLVSELIKKSLVEKFLNQIVDTEKITLEALHKKTSHKLATLYRQVTYFLTGIFITIACVSFVITRVIIQSEPRTASFNQELANLRLYSVPFITVPLVVCLAATIFYFFLRLEKITGLEIEALLKK